MKSRQDGTLAYILSFKNYYRWTNLDFIDSHISDNEALFPVEGGLIRIRDDVIWTEVYLTRCVF